MVIVVSALEALRNALYKFKTYLLTYRPSSLNIMAQGLFPLPFPPLALYAPLSKKGGRTTTTLHTTLGQPDGVALDDTSHIPGVAYWASL